MSEELQAAVAELQSKVSTLESKVRALEAQIAQTGSADADDDDGGVSFPVGQGGGG